MVYISRLRLIKHDDDRNRKTCQRHTEMAEIHFVRKLLLHAYASVQKFVAWRSDDALCPINEVAVRRAGLLLEWVTACGQVNHLGM